MRVVREVFFLFKIASDDIIFNLLEAETTLHPDCNVASEAIAS